MYNFVDEVFFTVGVLSKNADLDLEFAITKKQGALRLLSRIDSMFPLCPLIYFLTC